MNFTESHLLRILLLISSLMIFLISSSILLFFSLPHASWMPTVPDWQEVAPRILSQLHDDMDWPNDMDKDNFILLISITNFIGSMGYDRSTFYTVVSPNWTVFLTITSIFFLLLALTSIAMIYYLSYNYQISHRFVLIPWIILKLIMVFFLTFGLVSLLGDMTSTTRLQLEQIQGTKGNYAMVVTSLIVIILLTWFNIMAAYLHLEDKMMEKEYNDNLMEVISFSCNDPLSNERRR